MSNLDNILIIAAVAFFGAVIGPLLLARLNVRQQAAMLDQQAAIRHDEKIEDYARQDEVARVAAAQQAEVAAQAATAARLLLQAQQATTAKTEEVARVQAATAALASAKLDGIDAQTRRIHTLVNSDMTAARQSELNQTRAMLHVLERIVAARENGVNPDPDDIDAITKARKRIGDLEDILADRLVQLRKAEADTAAFPIPDGGDPA